MQAREDSKAVVENQVSLSVSDVSVLVGRHGRFRRLLERGNEFICDAQLNCKRREFASELDRERAKAREILVNYRLPKKYSTRFQSERMVPTGPNPLHNSNRSQVIFP